jgi:anti-sigma regulatory factor (Ser/Thr protein kinase)
MTRKSRDNPEVRKFIISNVGAHAGDISKVTQDKFKLSRMTANRYLDKLVSENVLEYSGETRARKYRLKPIFKQAYKFDVTKETEEHVVWREYMAPHLTEIPKNVFEMCEYGATEMINNVIDHSKSAICYISTERNARGVELWVIDEGVGIFNKIAEECGLNDPREAILELSKGKLTTDPEHHSGEGIFFTSRMFTEFRIYSGELSYYHDAVDGDDDWLIERDPTWPSTVGTAVILAMSVDEKHTIQDIFRKYETDDHGAGIFSKTHVPIRLALYPNEQLISRSQARRVLSRFNKFTEVILDFKDVPMIGQAFADEIFRVFRNTNPNVKLIPIRENQQVREMITRAVATSDVNQPDLFEESDRRSKA